MKKVYVFLADGFEDVEALIPIDVLRRGGVDVTTVSITDFPLVQSAHGVNIEADVMFEQCDFSDADLLFLPGGMPGATNLFDHKGVCKAIVDQHAAGKKVAAIYLCLTSCHPGPIRYPRRKACHLLSWHGGCTA